MNNIHSSENLNLNSSLNSIGTSALGNSPQQQKITNHTNHITQPQQQSESQRFNVLIRIRPEIPNDLEEIATEEELKPCIFKKSKTQVLLRSEKTDNDYQMTFDYILNEKSEQSDVYAAFGEKLVRDVFKGYNGTIMAYGQTGSGKSYTVFGKNNDEMYQDNKTEGIFQRAVHQIFEYKQENSKKKAIHILVSFFQVYLNQITDLLGENNKIQFEANEQQFKLGKDSKNLSIKNKLKIAHDKNGVYLKDLSVEEFSNENDLLDRIEEVLAHRVTEKTIMNKVSSRSHAIIKITIKQKWLERIKNNTINEITDNLHNLKSTLTVVDLAGSESVSRTGSEGKNQDEAKEINKSISALGRVIEALSKNVYATKQTHVSFRDSKLTEILSDSLGGNSKTVIIACVSHFTANYEETYSTLQFASRAMVIRTQVKRNEKIDTKKFNKDGNANGNNGDNNNLFSQGGENLYSPQKNVKGKGNYSVDKKINEMKMKFDNMNRGRNYNVKAYGLNNENYTVNSYGIKMGNKEDFKNITKKFYSMIIHLQEELGKLTIKNYALEEENDFLREQIKNYN